MSVINTKHSGPLDAPKPSDRADVPSQSQIPQSRLSTSSHSSNSSHATHVDQALEDEGNATATSQDPEIAEPDIPDSERYTIFTHKQKLVIVFIASFAGFFSPLAANIYFPALNVLARDLNVSSELINLTLTSYLIFQGIAPTLVGDAADMFGRRPLYVVCFVVFVSANIGLALQKNYAALFVLRCLQSSGSSGTIALSYGTVADVSVTGERGKYMGYASAGFMLGPSIGPVLGGVLAQYLGWKAIFWFLAIFAGSLLIVIVFFFPETGRNVVGNGSVPPQPWNISLLTYIQLRRERAKNGLERTQTSESGRQARDSLAKLRKLHIPNPVKAIKVVVERDCALILFYNSFIYTAFYMVLASLPVLLEEAYGYDTLHVGLIFIPFGVGCAIAVILNGRILDWNYQRIARQLGFSIDYKRGDDLTNFPIEKARIQVALPLAYIGSALLIVYGWLIQARVNIAGIVIVLLAMGMFVNGAFNVSSVLLVDLYPSSPSTATSANNLVRCLMGAAGSAAVTPMTKAMGEGWCFTFLGLFLIAASPMSMALIKWGPGWREARRVRLEEAKKREDKKREMLETPLERREGQSDDKEIRT